MPVLSPLKPHPVLAAFDRKLPVAPKSAFIRARKVEVQYAQTLRKVARSVGDLVKELWTPEDPLSSATETGDALRRYARTIEGWARSVGRRMIADVAARDVKAWQAVSREMGEGLIAELAESSPIGQVVQERLSEQVRLITSLPTEAAKRVHEMTLKGITEGRRAADIADEIYRTGAVTRARANLIARTETGRTATELTLARAKTAGAEGYIWRTAKDGHTRPSHRAMEGRYVRFDEPPTLDKMTGHAGALPNCRCYVEPVLSHLE